MSLFPLKKKSWIVHVSTYPPRECGIATFTQDIVKAFDNLYLPREESKVVAMNIDEVTKYPYDDHVIDQIPQQTKAEYIRAAERLNKMKHVKLVSIQHEFGIYGGNWGEYIIDFLAALRKPAVVTMHTVLSEPENFTSSSGRKSEEAAQIRSVVARIAAHAALIFVMTELSRQVLINVYGVSKERIKVVPHGIHPQPYVTSDVIKQSASLKKDLKGRTVLSTFGLLSKGKGIEYAIEALPAIVKKYPNVLYVVIGATHPVVLREEGESYRTFLTEKVRSLGLERHVYFYNKYLETKELLLLLQATDIYLSLSLNPYQAVSGTLAYALGAGRPVISTAFSQAKEIVDSEVGILVGFKDSAAITDAIDSLLSNKERMIVMGKKAYFRTRSATWPNVALSYMRRYINVVPEIGMKEKNLPPIKLQHFSKMTDQFGMFQFAYLNEPNPDWGYTIDDNARALIATINHYARTKSHTALKLAQTYLDFMEYVQREDGHFENYVDKNKNTELAQNRSENLEDANARAIYACAFVATHSDIPEQLKEKAATLFKNAKVFNQRFNFSHSISFVVKALALWMNREDKEQSNNLIKEYADKLVALYKETNTPQWQWYEETMSYSNGLIPEALLWAYESTKDEQYFEVALKTLDFLVGWSFQDDVCVPIGHDGWFRKGGEKHIYDQQPEEVTALVLALGKAYSLTKNEAYRATLLNAFWWFLGNNTLRQVVYDQTTGGCYDGVGEREINLNQGAESTVSYLLARLAVDSL